VKFKAGSHSHALLKHEQEAVVERLKYAPHKYLRYACFISFSQLILNGYAMTAGMPENLLTYSRHMRYDFHFTHEQPRNA
jgi:hypothetical protein